MNCLFCSPYDEYAWLHIKNYEYWHVELRNNQNYLGWCLVVLNRHIEDVMNITNQERDELFVIAKRLRDVIKKQFGADSLNYAFLGNVTNHVHLQVVPRYSKPVIYEGVTFIDKNWGSNYSPYDKSFDVRKEVKLFIKESLQKEL